MLQFQVGGQVQHSSYQSTYTDRHVAPRKKGHCSLDGHDLVGALVRPELGLVDQNSNRCFNLQPNIASASP